MCGITGWIDWSKDLTKQHPILSVMTEVLSPRGPDAKGFWVSTHAALGHRRLAVIDLEGGSQPMIRKAGNKTYVIVYNGELYNTSEIKSELESRGHRFLGSSDTEVLLASYIEWGPSCLDRLNGIFAFGVWDDIEQTLFVARDRMGVKPLFYALRNNSLLFASELKSLLANPLISPEIDGTGLADILVLAPSRTPGSGVFRNVKELKPGHCLIFNRNGLKVRRYWQLDSHPHTDDPTTTLEKVRSLVQDAIERQLVSDVPVCCFLSGGLDSSLITSVAAQSYKKQGREPLHTYSVDYKDNDKYFKTSLFQPNSDSDWIGKVTDYLGTVHHQVIIDTPMLAEALKNAVIARDLPGMADVDSSLYLFCREIKKDATVALSGECADEIFGGYPWYHNEEALTSKTFPWSRKIDAKMMVFSPELVDIVRPDEYMNRRYTETIEEVPVLAGEDPIEAKRREIFYLNFNWFMQTLLDRKDRMSMASGLEVRVPFCDHRIVEYVWNIPWSMKNQGGMEKGLLREAMRGSLPEDVLYRRKSPYPKTHNPNYLAKVKEMLSEILNDPSSPLVPLLNMKVVERMVNSEDDTFDCPWYGQLMTGPQLFAFLIQVDTWLRHYHVAIV